MLSILKRGTVQAGNTTWEFHGDSENDKIFYITPQPQFVMNGGLPKIEIVEYQTNDAMNGSGYALVQVELGIPQGALEPIGAQIKNLFHIENPIFQTLAVQSGTVVNITYPDGHGGTAGQQVNGSDFASNTAIAQLPLDPDQMKEVKKVMSAGGSGPFAIEFSVIVPAYMPAVTASIAFDSAIAYQYQVTAHPHEKWAQATTYTYEIAKTLTASNASSITINKIDPTLSNDVVNSVRQWAQTIIETRVAKEVEEQIARLNSSGGTQPFSVSQISSFSETYSQNETIMWRVRPSATLPSFIQLGLTANQMSSLEPKVDIRKFIATVTPAVKFETAGKLLAHTAGGMITEGDNPFMTNVKPLKSLEVTIIYPTLAGSSERTFRFTSNEAHAWTADWDNTAGGKYSLSYTANYSDGQQIKGEIKDLDVSAYTLHLADVGTLNVTFNATKFFKSGGSTSSGIAAVDSLIVDFVFEAPDQKPFLQTFTLDSKNPTYTVTSVFGAPVSTYYNYTLTYNFKAGAAANPFMSNVRRQNSATVDVCAPDLTQDVAIHVDMGDQNTGFIEVSMNFYYDGEPVFPAIDASQALPRPTASSPIHFDFTPDDKPTQTQNLTIFANSKLTPLMVKADGILKGGKVKWGPVRFNPLDVAILSFSQDKLFTFVEIDPVIVNWKKNATGDDVLTSINVQVTAAKYKTVVNGNEIEKKVYPSSSTQSIAFDTQQNKAPSSFFEIDDLPTDCHNLSFAWEATYVYKTAGSITIKGETSGTKVALPATADKPASQSGAAG